MRRLPPLGPVERQPAGAAAAPLAALRPTPRRRRYRRRHSEKADAMASDMKKWFPTAARAAHPVLRLLCFHSAGGDCLMFTTRGTARAPQPNPLADYCEANNVELLAAQLPGRAPGSRDVRLTTAAAVAAAVVKVLRADGILAPTDSTPYAILGHSAGCLMAFEFLQLMRRENGPMPKIVFFSSMVAPTTPPAELPWRVSEGLSAAELQDQCRMWAANEELYQPEIWSLYEPMIRADFKIYDEYPFPAPPQAPFQIPLVLIRGARDAPVPRGKMSGWGPLVAGAKGVEELEVDCRHNVFYDVAAREAVMKFVADRLDRVLLDLEY